MRFSIRNRIFLAFVVVQFISAVLVVGWYFYTLHEDLRGFSRSEAEEKVLQTVASTRDYFGPPATTARLTASLLEGGVLDRSRPLQLERFFFEQLRQSPAVAGLFVGYPDGAFYYVSRSDEHAVGGTRTKLILVDPGSRAVVLRWRDQAYRTVETASDPDDPYDPRTRPWYEAAQSRGDLVWTEPYIFFTARKPGVTAAVPVIGDGGEIEAVVGLDIELSAVSRFLLQLGFRSSGSAFVLTRDGEVIAHADATMVLAEQQQEGDALRFRTVDELPGVEGALAGSLIAAADGDASSGTLSVSEQEYEGEGYYVASESVSDDDWPWRVVAIVRAAGVESTLGSANLMLIGIVLFATTFACFAGWMIAGNVGRPVTALHRDAKQARQGNFELMGEARSGYREIDETHGILEAMAREKRGLDGERRGS